MSDEARTDYKLPETVRLTIGVLYHKSYGKPTNQGTVAQAVDMLARHNLELDVWPYGGVKQSGVNTIGFKEKDEDVPLVEPKDRKDIYKKAKEILNARCSFIVPVPVVYCNFVGPAYGETIPIQGAMTDMVFISRTVNKDLVTLLHELGHVAGMSHDRYSTKPKNFMREDEPRTTIFKWQVQKFAKAKFSVA